MMSSAQDKKRRARPVMTPRKSWIFAAGALAVGVGCDLTEPPPTLVEEGLVPGFTIVTGVGEAGRLHVVDGLEYRVIFG